MDISEEVIKIIRQNSHEGVQLEFKSVLPPSKHMARQISAFANTEGGVLILGVSEAPKGFRVNGLSPDFHANSIVHKALDLLEPKPIIYYQYVSYEGKSIYAIKVEKAERIISAAGKVYKREGASSILASPPKSALALSKYHRIKEISELLTVFGQNATNAKSNLIEHYQSVLNIVNDLQRLLYPENPEAPTNNQEGKILTRILFSSFVDNFETYLSDLLFEIYLAIPETLKSDSPVTVKEVLNCSDMQEFIHYVAKKKISALQKGSVQGFIKKNKVISDLNVVQNNEQDRIEKILQIRHLYAHRNGIVDEKFLKFFPGEFSLNTEHQVSVSQICDNLEYLLQVVHRLDEAAISKYQLAAD